MKKKTNYFLKYCRIYKIYFFDLHFGGSKINTRVVPFSSIVGAGKLLDYIYMKKCICQNMRGVSFSKLHIQFKFKLGGFSKNS